MTYVKEISTQESHESHCLVTGAEVAQMHQAIEHIGSTRFHDHFEGIFNAKDLSSFGYDLSDPRLFESLGLRLPQPIIESMHNTMAPAEHKKDLTQFIGRLSTRWLRAGLMWGVLHGEESGLTAETILEGYFKAALEKMYREGVVNLELMMAPLNMTLEGDLSHVPLPHPNANASAEEIALINEWNEKVSQWKQAGVADRYVPTIRSYLKTFKKVVTQDDRFQWEDEDKPEPLDKTNGNYMPHGKRMKVTSVFQIRRDQKNDCILMDDPSSIYPYPNEQGQALMRELVSCYYGVDLDGPLIGGFNIAGIEDKPGTGLSRFTGFRKILSYNQIPLNVHATEIRLFEWIDSLKDAQVYQEYQENRDEFIPPAIRQGMNNLYCAIHDANIRRIGHGNLIPFHKQLMQLCIRLNKTVEACRTSNLWTSVATEQVHSIMEQANVLVEFFKIILPQVDDETIFDSEHPYAEEAVYFAKRTGMTNSLTYEEIAHYLRDQGEKVLIWKRKPAFRPKRLLPYDELPGTVVYEDRTS